MYAAQTTYHRASSIAEAVQILSDNEGAKILAGGHSLIPLMKLRLSAPETLVDIGRIDDLKGISYKDGAVCIGALTTHAEIASSDLVQQQAPLLAEAAGTVGDPAVRNRGTIGGNVSHADPASDLPTVLTALGATYCVSGPGGDRTIAAGDFATGLLESALEDNEVLTHVCVPSQASGSGSGLRQALAPGIAVRRSRRRRGRVSRRREVLVGQRGDRGRGGDSNEGVVRRVGAGGVGPERRRPGRGGGGGGRRLRR